MVEVQADAVTRAGELFGRGAWLECLAVLEQAQERGPLPSATVELMARTAYLVGREDASITLSEQAYARFEAAGEHRMAVRAATGLAAMLQGRGEFARSGAWAARARRLIEDHRLGGAEEGQLLALEAHVLLVRGRAAEAIAAAERSVELGRQSRDADSVVLGGLTLAWAALHAGQRAECMALFDEMMVSVCADETTAQVAGQAYCAVISACMELRDLPRATEWTDTLSTWCAARPDLVAYRGICRVHRAQVLTLRGRWPAAVDEATQACSLLPERQAGEAWYQLGELHRLRGQLDAAADAYRRANSAGRLPEPGLARLRVLQGRADVAVPALRRATEDAQTAEDRAELLSALAEALVTAGDLAGAEAAAQQLTRIAGELDAPLLTAMAAEAEGRVQLERDEPVTSLAALRRAWQLWRELELPFHAARVRVLIARCLRGLGDEASARMELEAARDVFDRLEAAPDRSAADGLLRGERALPGGLTDREVQIVRLVATGLTNRAIAEELFLSEKTVARHLSNIYAKLDVSSRAAATAYAYDHHLV